MEKIKPVVDIIFKGQNVTADVAPALLDVTYTDNETGKADEVELRFQDRFQLWRSELLPEKGDAVSLKIGYQGGALLDCGSFETDEISFDGPPDAVTIRGVATGIKKNLKNVKTKAWEKTTLKKIAGEIADGHSLKLDGDIPDVKFERLTQNCSDLSFLRELGDDYGCIFKIENGKLVFYSIESLHGLETAAVIKRSQVLTYSLRNSNCIRGVQVSYFNAKTNRVMTHTVTNPEIKIGGIKKIEKRFESLDQAKAYAKGQLKNQENAETSGSVTVYGNNRIVAGINFELEGYHKLDGKYHASVVKHTISAGSYVTSLEELRRIS
ncbi:MAG: phage late control D family protein [bacterium]